MGVTNDEVTVLAAVVSKHPPATAVPLLEEVSCRGCCCSSSKVTVVVFIDIFDISNTKINLFFNYLCKSYEVHHEAKLYCTFEWKQTTSYK